MPLQLQVLPRQYGGQAELVPAAAAVATRRAGEVQVERDPRRRCLAERSAPADEGRLAAARNATGCAIFTFAAYHTAKKIQLSHNRWVVAHVYCNAVENCAQCECSVRLQPLQPVRYQAGAHTQNSTPEPSPLNPGLCRGRRRWASSAWGGIKRGGAAVTHVRISPPHLPSLPPMPRLHMWWQHDDGGGGSSGSSPAQITLMRQHSIALQRAVAHSVSQSRLAAVSRRLLPTLQPLNPKVRDSSLPS